MSDEPPRLVEGNCSRCREVPWSVLIDGLLSLDSWESFRRERGGVAVSKVSDGVLRVIAISDLGGGVGAIELSSERSTEVGGEGGGGPGGDSLRGTWG